MLRRLLNIASIVCLVLCVALMAMWVRSYQIGTNSLSYVKDERSFVMRFSQGRLGFIERLPGPNDNLEYLDWSLNMGGGPTEKRKEDVAFLRQRFSSAWGFHTSIRANGVWFVIPFWFLVLTSGSLAMAFRLRWPPWRFSLGTLFIATTFLAVVLGTSAWLDRWWLWK